MDLTGLKPVIAAEICHLASLDGDVSAREFSDAELTHLFHAFTWIMDDVREAILRRISSVKGETGRIRIGTAPMMEGGNYKTVNFSSISEL